MKTGDAIERRGIVAKEKGTSFTSFEALGKALTPKRLELLHSIKAKKPSSIIKLARFAKRDVKNISDDVNYLEQIQVLLGSLLYPCYHCQDQRSDPNTSGRPYR